MRARVIITGSRDWDDEVAVRNALSLIALGHGGGPITMYHGACPTGADAIADQYATELDWEVKRFPAKWDLHGKAAGPIRNGQMVSALLVDMADRWEPNLIVAFIRNGSRGASDCLRNARESGIPWVTYTQTDKQAAALRVTLYCKPSDSSFAWRWTITAANGRTVGASTQGYSRRIDAVRNLELITGRYWDGSIQALVDGWDNHG